VFSEALVDMLSCTIALVLSENRGVLDKNKQAQWWVAFNLDPSARPPEPQGVLSAGWSEVSPIFEPTAEGADALCVFTTDYGATTYMHSLSAQQGLAPHHYRGTQLSPRS
jgi:hypothetical protein